MKKQHRDFKYSVIKLNPGSVRGNCKQHLNQDAQVIAI